ncbi:MAG: 3-deoxy-manno-octulosonate cytidylyltransferase [Planctomycetes bacterium]|nr:3-deoxy-manno-octulosonate cytidylyltransferase [Planctomycetota bacterium]
MGAATNRTPSAARAPGRGTTAARVRAVAVIPARLGSTRLPRKPLLAETGRPLIQHVHEAVAASGLFARVVVATDSPEVLEAVRRFGGEAVLTDAAHPSGTDRVAEAARSMDCDLVVNVQGDEPGIATGTLEALLTRMEAEPPQVPMGTCAVPLGASDPRADSPHVVKVVVDEAGYALYFSRARIPHAAAHGVPARLRRHVGVYAYRPAFLQDYAAMAPTGLELSERLEQLRALGRGHRIAVADVAEDSAGIDTPEEYAGFVARWRSGPGGQRA